MMVLSFNLLMNIPAFFPPHLCLYQIWCDHCRQPQGPFTTSSVEPPADPLQGTESPGGRPTQQPEGKHDPVQQTTQAGQPIQSGEFNLHEERRVQVASSPTFIMAVKVIRFAWHDN